MRLRRYKEKEREQVYRLGVYIRNRFLSHGNRLLVLLKRARTD